MRQEAAAVGCDRQCPAMWLPPGKPFSFWIPKGNCPVQGHFPGIFNMKGLRDWSRLPMDSKDPELSPSC